MKNSKTIRIILGVMLTTFIFLSIVGYSYAYFSLEIDGIGKDVIMSTADLRLIYKDDTELKLVDAMPGDSVSKVITVSNVGTKNATYTLYWGNLINTIQNFELHVTLECKSYINYGESNQTESGTCDKIYRAVPISNTVTTGNIKKNISIEPGITQEYTVTIKFDNKNCSQDDNINKTFTGKIGIEEYTAPEVVNCTFDGELTQGAEYVNGQYTYRYKQEGDYSLTTDLAWTVMYVDGWGVQLTDKASTDAVTDSVCTYINNVPVTSMAYMYYKSKTSSINLTNVNTSKVTSMSGMFRDTQVTSLDVSNFDTSNVTNMFGIFQETQIEALDLSNFDTSKVTNMTSMFYASKVKIVDLSNFNTEKVENMNSMFFGSKAEIIDLSNFDTSNVTSMSGMFRESYAKTLDLSSFETSNVTDMNSMFETSKATTIDLSSFDTSKVTNMSVMFKESYAEVLDLSNFDTSNVTDMGYMFYNCNALTTIYVGNKFTTDKVTSSSSMFYLDSKLVGGAGTVYNSSYVDKTYARVDGGTSSPGYFTLKN